MTSSSNHLDHSAHPGQSLSGKGSPAGGDELLCQRLKSAGMVLLYCNERGEMEPRDAGTSAAPIDETLWRLLNGSPLVAQWLREATSRWSEVEEPSPCEPIPGLWFSPIPLSRGRSRRPSASARVQNAIESSEQEGLCESSGTRTSRSRRDARRAKKRGDIRGQKNDAPPVATSPRTSRHHRQGYAVIVLLTDAIVGGLTTDRSEYLAAMCQAASLDYKVTRSMLTGSSGSNGLAPSADAHRLLGLARCLFDDYQAQTASVAAMESTGQQLAESYEEIALLYTIIGSMSVVEQPDRFVKIACEELLDTLPYGWIGAQMCANRGRVKQLAGRFFLAGDFPTSTGSSFQRPPSLIVKLLEMVQPDAPLVLEPFTNESHAEFRPLGNTVLVHPVTSDGSVIGVLAAGEKQGPDPSASNVDMKLLGAIASHMAIFLENVALYDDLNAMFLGTLEALTASIDAKDRYTCGHSQRVAHLTSQLARALGLDENVVRRMHIAGLVHDVGKIGVPENLLLKPGRLTEEEFAWIKRHPEIGYRILKDIPQLQDILPGVLYHHERWDGMGYPRGLAEDDIPLVARLIGLADSFDAMSSTRTYRSAMDRRQVLKEIERCAGTQFDPKLVPLFLDLDFEEYDRLMVEHRAGGASPGISSAA